MKKTKRLLAALFAIFMVAAMLPVTAFAAEKKEYPDLEKRVNGEERVSAAAGDTLDFTLTSNVPVDLWKCFDFLNEEGEVKYPGTLYEGAKYELTFHDMMAKVLDLDEDSFTVTIGGVEIDADNYEIVTENLGDTCTFHVVLDLVKLYEDGVINESAYTYPTPIVVAYRATLTDAATAGTYKNKSKVSWDKKIVDREDPGEDPGEDPDPEPDPGESEEDEVDVDTYKILLTKFDAETKEKTPLAGAKFKLEMKDAEGNWTQVGTDKTTGADGIAEWTGLKEGDYRLTETEAPTDYIKNGQPLTVTLGKDANDNNIAKPTFGNRKTPGTGGSGTMLYTVGGLAILCCAAGVFIVSRKKKTER